MREKKEIYQSSHDMIWGVSQEAAVCITCPEMGRGTFIRTTFYRNFNYQYLYMYILLLHQKYVLYMFLTEIGVGRYNTLETLILSVFSALIDSFDFSASFLGGTLKFGPVVVHGVQGVCILLIFLTAAGVMKSLFVSKKEKLKE